MARQYHIDDSRDYGICEKQLFQKWQAAWPGLSAKRPGRPSIREKILSKCEEVYQQYGFGGLWKFIGKVRTQLGVQKNGKPYGFTTVRHTVLDWLKTKPYTILSPSYLRRRKPVQDLALWVDEHCDDLRTLHRVTFSESMPFQYDPRLFQKDPRQLNAFFDHVLRP